MLSGELTNKIVKLERPRSDAYDVISFLSNRPYDEVKGSTDIEINETLAIETLKRMETGEPTAYITNRREFFGLEFYVNESVLIPRVETEVLVSASLETVGKLEKPKILDLCAGSGCILLSLLANSESASGVGVDISSEALEVAKKNALKFGLEKRCEFKEHDALSFIPKEKFDIITCNPPYVSDEEYESCEISIKREPKSAIVSAGDVLFFYKKILCNIDLLCKKNGAVFFEIGYSQKPLLTEILADYNIRHDFMKDFAGNDRVLVCYV